MTLYLIRHGETEGAEARRYKGSIDVPLSEKGIKQMRRVRTFIGKYQSIKASKLQSINDSDTLTLCRSDTSLAAVYCSNLSRAIKSAEIIAKPHGIKPVIIPELRERNFGIWEGMSFDEIRDKYPDEFDAWANNPLKFSPIGGESTLEVRDRVIRAVNVILNNNSIKRQVAKGEKRIHDTRYTIHDKKYHESCIVHHASNIAIVAHGGVNRIILCHFLCIPLENIFRIEQDYGAVNIIEIWDKYPVVKLINGRAASEDEHGRDRA